MRTAFHDIIDDHTVTPYTSSSKDDVWDALKVLFTDTNNSDNIILSYSRRSEAKGNSGQTTGWNREHIWCNSYGIDSNEPAYTDLFNLLPADWNVNSSRGNLFYDSSDSDDSSYKVPGFHEAPLTSRDSNSWEPPDTIKGDVARASFYMDLRYDGNASDEPDLILTNETDLISSSNTRFGKLSTLLIWHQLDPVSLEEIERNRLIYELYQKNRNPFIDYPELALALHKENENPLIFLSASYYTDTESFDVKGLLNNEVADGEINLTIGNHTMGGDPQFGKSKFFFARYAYKGKVFELTLSEGDTLSIPDTTGGNSGGNGNGRAPIWNDTDLYYVKSFSQTEQNSSLLRSYDLLAKSRKNFSNQVQSIVLPLGSKSPLIENSSFSKEGYHFIFENSFEDSSALVNDYPLGSYKWTIGDSITGNQVVHNVDTSLPVFPAISPKIIGAQWKNDTLLLDLNNPILEIERWSSPGSNDKIEYGFWSNSGSGGGTASSSASNLDLTWFDLREGDEMQGYLFYNNIVNSQQNVDPHGDQFNARFGHVTALYFKLRVTSGREDNSSNLGDLEILEATYGTEEKFNELTSILQSKIVNNRLNLLVRSSQLGGDPAFGEVKSLSVKYRFGGSSYRVSVSEYDTLSIPNPNHQLIEPTLSEVMANPGKYDLIALADLNATLSQKWDEGFAAGINAVKSSPSSYQLFTQSDFNASKQEALSIVESNRSKWIDAGTIKVLDSPSEFGLLLKGDVNSTIKVARQNGYDEGFSTGNNIVLENPSLYNLYSELDLNASKSRSLSKGYLAGIDFVMSNGLVDKEDYDQEMSQYSADSKATPYTSGWYFQPSRGWLYTNSSSYPYIYDSNTSNWLYFEAGHEIPLYYEYSSKNWIKINGDD